MWSMDKDTRYTNKDNFTVHKKSQETYGDLEEDVEERFSRSNNEVERPLLKAKNK